MPFRNGISPGRGLHNKFPSSSILILINVSSRSKMIVYFFLFFIFINGGIFLFFLYDKIIELKYSSFS